jgi:hypothetical protein
MQQIHNITLMQPSMAAQTVLGAMEMDLHKLALGHQSVLLSQLQLLSKPLHPTVTSALASAMASAMASVSTEVWPAGLLQASAGLLQAYCFATIT